jgi:hypothetical protein
MEDTSEILAITIYGFPMEQALPAAMIVGTLVDPMATLLNANGDVVSAMLIPNLEVAFKHVDYIIYRRKFYQTKAAFLLLRNVFIGSCLNTILAPFFNYYVINK